MSDGKNTGSCARQMIARRAVANAFFPVIHVSLENLYGDAARMLAYLGIFLPSYAIFGALALLAATRRQITGS